MAARGTTASHKGYIDLAAAMGWRYQLLDWLWYENMTSYDRSLLSKPKPERADFTHSAPDIDIPELLRIAIAAPLDGRRSRYVQAAELSVPLSFLSAGAWSLRAFADQPDGSDARQVPPPHRGRSRAPSEGRRSGHD